MLTEKILQNSVKVKGNHRIVKASKECEVERRKLLISKKELKTLIDETLSKPMAPATFKKICDNC